MIALLLMQASLDPIGRQALPASGCAAFLWSRGDAPQLVAMVGAEPGSLKLRFDGKTVELPRTAAEGAAGRGLPAQSRYAAGDVTATVALSAQDRADLSDGALVSDATLTVARTGKDTTVVPAGGLIGCAPVR